jgi:hypothetical protein
LCNDTPLCEFDEYLDGDVDGANDIYTFSVFGYVGKFIFDPFQNACIFLNKSELKIDRINDFHFKESLPNGNIIHMVRKQWYGFVDHAILWYPEIIISFDMKDTISFFYEHGGYMYGTLKDNILI